ncbi:sugar phosphate isomerase/epimerase family protein [Neolewinella antarctica]|uniref:Sugar phosphate isomerase/epimerase n=1 Tax=Neolewinella antarctica TaxID=442734 RepID=A0ABX0X7Z5_9BACT|nr:sugar phosphate isomerase/epimerase [Neolewinella antarctica]NJC25099.1 sugar phosphate isomerase/epimerase [Neolewinella antarctica]
MLSRKDFIRHSVIAAAGLPLLGCGNSGQNTAQSAVNMEPLTGRDYLNTIGLQLWSVRDQWKAAPRLTLETLAEIGYKQIELQDTRHASELAPIAKDLGLQVHSSFINWNTITGGWEYTPDDPLRFEFAEVMDQANEHGLSHIVFGYLEAQERDTADKWRKLADDLNEAGMRAKNNGLQLTYHNHNFEWDPIEGTTGFDILMDRMDGDLVPFELDIFWAQIAGQDARQTMTKVKDRLELLHLKQLNPKTPVITDINDVPSDAFEELPDGNIPIKELMDYGQELGVKYCMVEQDDNYEESSLKSVQKSLEWLQTSEI